MKKLILGLMMAALAFMGFSPVVAEENPVSTTSSMTEMFTKNLGMTEVLPNFYLSAQQMEELRTSQCTAGPNGLFSELRAKMAKKEWQWCSPKVNAELDSFFKSGAIGYTLMAGPSGVRLTVYDQAVNLNRNVRCHTDIPYAGMFQLQFTCFDSQSGAQIRSQIVGQILGNAIPTWGATVLSNLTAAQAGDTNIITGSEAGAVADAASNGGSGSAPDIHITNSPLFNPAFNVNAGVNAEVNGAAGTCGTPACH